MLEVSPVPVTGGPTTSVSRIVSAAATTNATSAKASAGALVQIAEAEYFEATLRTQSDTAIDILAIGSWFAMRIIE